MSEIQEVFAPGIKVVAKGEEVTAMPYEFLEIFEAIALIEPVSASWDAAAKSEMGLITAITKMFGSHKDAAIKLIGMSIKKDAEWFKGLSGTDGAKIVRAVVKVNIDFFTREIAPMFEEMGIWGAVKPDQVPMPGNESSEYSQAPDTTQQGSSTTPSPSSDSGPSLQ